jgi:regulator of extracellular matrix RemA (YlzA/DUF370 family)
LFIHIGEKKVLCIEEVMGIFDYTAIAESETTKAFIENKSRKGLLVRFSEKRSKSFIVCENGEVLLSPISSSTLEERYISLAEKLKGR